jgi:hypothetical protein
VSVLSDPVVRYRLGLTAELTAYVAAIILTGFVPLSPVLDVPLVLVGWISFGGLILWAGLGRRRYPTRDMLDTLLRPWPLTLTFAVLVVIASYFAIGWHVPAVCNGIPLSCLKGYQWSIQNGHFYHVTPDGLSEQISRATYIQEVGVHLRSAAAFGLYSLCLAWLAASALKRPAL